MAIMKMEGGPKFGFLVSEANDWRSRDEVEVDNSAGTEPLLAGSLLAAGATATDPAVAWASGATTGILAQTVPAGETAKRTIISREAEVNGAMLVVPDGSTLAAATTALADLQIIVRTNKGLKIDPVNQI